MTVKISIQLLSDYQPANVASAMTALLAPLGGMRAFIGESETVVVKPNLLAPRAVERATNTHPEIVRETARQLHACGTAKVLVTDSSGIGTAVQVARRMGLHSEGPMEIVNPDEAESISSPGGGMWKLRLSKLMLSHPVINVAKAKTHGQMIVTAAVKNMFGGVLGLEKAQWHYRIGKDPMAFGRLIVHIHQTLAPRLNILDGVIGMEGNGPGSGTPRQLGFLMASENAHALDYVLCRIWKLNPDHVYTIRAAREQGLLPADDEIEIIGPDIKSLHPSPDWQMASHASVAKLFGPAWLTPVLERLLQSTPRVHPSKCTMCLECVHHCAANAMDASSGQIEIDMKKCISCFCCQEMCPHSAITVQTGFLAQLLRLGR
ncbi:MAG: DUF362 domain-containing protein [Deltaproteobacteria bacterium]|nr:DUF362 domain-containing protein [Deltaproteobacteria bacterium]